MIQSLRCSALKKIKVCSPRLTEFWKIFLFILFRWLSAMTQIFFPNLVASKYVLLTVTITCFPKFKGFFILFVSNVSLWLFIMFSWMLFLSFFVLGAWLHEGNIEFSLSADSCLSWHSSMGRISDEFRSGIL